METQASKQKEQSAGGELAGEGDKSYAGNIVLKFNPLRKTGDISMKKNRILLEKTRENEKTAPGN